ncbi:MAG: ABC transporter substrate-binding protein [Streptosporangiales bacterium]|nr:ABC transporter substrate-binding protein [Streptosporangiales bacterium]
MTPAKDSRNDPSGAKPRHRRPRRAAGALLLASVVVAASCTTGEGGEGPQGQGDNTFDIAIGIDLDTVDPAQMTTTTVANVVDYSVETLTKLKKDAGIGPGLARSWEVSEDGRTMTLRLRDGVTFHDGTPLDAEAVKYNLDRLLDTDVEVPQRAAYTVIDNVEVVDDSTVRLNLSNPSPALPSALSASTAGIISPTSAEKRGNSYKNITHPVGTGPYTFQSFRSGDRVVFQRYDAYWGRKPHYRRVVFRLTPEAATRESQLRAGQAEMIILPPVSDLKALQQSPDTDVLIAPSDRTIFIALDTTEPPLDDKRVRQALNYAVDKKALVDNLMFGAAKPLDSPMAPPVDGYCRTGGYDYDPQRARQLLAEAGVRDLSITLGTPTGRYLQDKQAADAISGNLREVGVNAQVQTTDWASYIAATAVPAEQQKYDVHVLGWAPAFLDASQQFQQFQTDQHPPAGLATSFYSNKEVDSLVADANQELDAQKRDRLYCDALKIVWDDAPWIFGWVQQFPIAYSSSITGVSYLPNEKFDAIYARPKG